jgi:tetratricopeptide (TPR) repeat protein
MVATTLFMFSPPKLGQKILSRKSTYAGLLILILTVGAGVWFSRFNPFWEHVPGLSRLKDISLSDASLLPRRVALSVAWQGFLEKPLTGWGWENFNIVFNKHYDPRLLSAGYQETRFDKPHNAILEYLVTGGLPLFLAFIGLSIAFIFEVYKNRDKTFAVMMTALLCGYIVRNAFVFDTVGPVMMMMMVFGWVDWQYWKNRERSQTQTTVTTTQKKNQREDEDGREVIALLLCCASIIPVYFFNILSLEASYYQYQGFNSFVHNKSYAGISNFKTAIEIYSPYTGNFKRDYAIAAAEAHFGSPGSVKKQDVLDAIAGMEQTTSEHPLDAYNHYSLVDLYNQVSDLDKENFTRKAEEHAARALNLSPDRQEVLFSLAKTKTLEKKYPEAIELLKKAISLNENIADAQFYYGLVSYAAGDQGEGYKGIKKGLELGRKWKNANEAIVVANFFADSGHIDGAIDLYRKATELDASNLEAKIKLGIAYYVKGDRENAKKYIEQTINQFDITKSNSYEDIVPILIDLGLAVH